MAEFGSIQHRFGGEVCLGRFSCSLRPPSSTAKDHVLGYPAETIATLGPIGPRVTGCTRCISDLNSPGLPQLVATTGILTKKANVVSGLSWACPASANGLSLRGLFNSPMMPLMTLEQRFFSRESYGIQLFGDDCRSGMETRLPVSGTFDRQQFRGQNSGLWRGSVPVPVKM